jgi:hypothetical protein
LAILPLFIREMREYFCEFKGKGTSLGARSSTTIAYTPLNESFEQHLGLDDDDTDVARTSYEETVFA